MIELPRPLTTLTVDIFGTVMDLSQSLIPPIDQFLAAKGAACSGLALWEQWRARQRIEQYQDSLMMLGHAGYLETCRRALVYCLRDQKISFTPDEVNGLMQAWRELNPFEDAVEGLALLGEVYKLVALSNGDESYLGYILETRIPGVFDDIISVDLAGVFKPHPAAYRAAAQKLCLEPAEVMMVAAHSFDIMGARACGYRGAYINRYSLPFEETWYQPDIEVRDFIELSKMLIPGG